MTSRVPNRIKRQEENIRIALGIMTGIYKTRYERIDSANRRHPLLKPIPDVQIKDVGDRIYYLIGYIIEYAKAEIPLDINLSIELDAVKRPKTKEEAKELLRKELKGWLMETNQRGMDAARLQERFAIYRVNWEQKNIDAARFLDDYTIKLSDYLSAQAEFELRSTIQDGLLKGEGAVGISRMIKEQVTETYKNRSMNIARTEGMRALNGGRRSSYKEMGFDEVFWIASDLACEKCKPLDGRIYQIDDMPPQPLHFGCRCTHGAVTQFTPRRADRVDYDFDTAPEGFTW